MENMASKAESKGASKGLKSIVYAVVAGSVFGAIFASAQVAIGINEFHPGLWIPMGAFGFAGMSFVFIGIPIAIADTAI